MGEYYGKEIREIPEIKRLKLKKPSRRRASKIRDQIKENSARFLNGVSESLKESRQLRQDIETRLQPKTTSPTTAAKPSGPTRRQFIKRSLQAAAAVTVANTAMGAVTDVSMGSRAVSAAVRSAAADSAMVLGSSLRFNDANIPEVAKIIRTRGIYANAKYIVVIPHTTELDALTAAREAAQGPITWVEENRDRTAFTRPHNLRNLWIRTNEDNYQIDANCAFCHPGMHASFNSLNKKGTFEQKSQPVQQQVTSAADKFAAEIEGRIYHGKMIILLELEHKTCYIICMLI